LQSVLRTYREACGGSAVGTWRNAAVVNAAAPAPEANGGNMGRSVLIVDDEPNIVRSLQFLMAQAGYEVRVARDGEQALEEIAKSQPDLVLLDAMMPRRDGFDVCQTIRANPRWADVRVIMLTAKGREIEREKGMAMGADDYITKPFSTKEVMAQVEKVLAGAGRSGDA
jgi:two-component system, OmpR family, alkaline phosphatase synthesis response regulator PhoP